MLNTKEIDDFLHHFTSNNRKTGVNVVSLVNRF